MAEPCLSDIDLAIAQCEFLIADLEDLKLDYISECEFALLDRVRDSKCRTVQSCAVLCFNMKVDIAAYPTGPLTAIVFGDYECS